jgi:hypothetical protein
MAAVTSIMRAQQILLGELDALLRPYGLTFARYEALVLLTPPASPTPSAAWNASSW